MGFLGGSDCKESACNTGGLDSILGLGSKSPGEANGYPLKYSCLENHTDRGAWRATLHGVKKKLVMTERLTLSLLSFVFRSNAVNHYAPVVGI